MQKTDQPSVMLNDQEEAWKSLGSTSVIHTRRK